MVVEDTYNLIGRWSQKDYAFQTRLGNMERPISSSTSQFKWSERASDLMKMELEFSTFRMVQKQCVFSRNHTLSFDLQLVCVLEIHGRMLPSRAGQQL